MEFREKLSILRKEKGLSQEKLAELIGISRQAVARWELGQGYPDIDNLILLSNIFKLTVDRLIKPEDDNYFLSYCQNKLLEADEEFIGFLLKAKLSTYAAKAPQEEPSRPKSHDLKYAEGEYLYIDTYLGGEKFGGEEAVWYQNNPVWVMNYHGRIVGAGFSGDFLKEALLMVTREMPYRGPALYQNGDYTYHCNVSGNFEWFQGKEEIFCNSNRIYEGFFHGGRIN